MPSSRALSPSIKMVSVLEYSPSLAPRQESMDSISPWAMPENRGERAKRDKYFSTTGLQCWISNRYICPIIVRSGYKVKTGNSIRNRIGNKEEEA